MPVGPSYDPATLRHRTTPRFEREFSLPWAGGIVDGCGKFRLRVDPETDRVFGADVWAVCGSDEAAKCLQEILGGEVAERTWVCYACDQAETIRSLLPYMRDKTKIHAARRVMLFRLTQTTGRLTPVIKELRKQLAHGLPKASKEDKRKYQEYVGGVKFKKGSKRVRLDQE